MTAADRNIRRNDRTYADLDNDTKQYGGTTGPFEDWEHDHTGLVHVLWHAKHCGLNLIDDADEIATMIMRSRWLVAQRAHEEVGQ